MSFARSLLRGTVGSDGISSCSQETSSLYNEVAANPEVMPQSFRAATTEFHVMGVTTLTVVKADESKVRVQRDPCLTGPHSVYRLVSSSHALMGWQM